MAGNNRSLEKVLEIIESHRKKVKSRKSRWRGTLEEYLGLVIKNPQLAETAHQRLWRVLFKNPGWKEVKASENPKLARALGLEEDEGILIYNAWKDNFFGIEKTIEVLARYFEGGARKAEGEYKKALCLVGPVGGAKSSILEKKASLLEGEPLYIPEWEEDKPCTHLCDPLWFLPRSERAEFSKALGVEIDLDFDICPKCRRHLREDLGNDYTKVIIVEETFSKRKRGIVGRGIAQVTPVELENADISVLIGSIAIPELDEKLQADPDAIELTGVYSQGNRGFVEHIEGFTFPIEMLYPLITQTQEKRVGAPGRQAMLWVDTVPILHMNQEIYERFLSDPENEKFKDRIYTVFVPYNLRFDEEIKIFEKLIERSAFKNFHRAPYTLNLIALFDIFTRLKLAKEGDEKRPIRDPFIRARVLNGNEVKIPGTTQLLTGRDIKEDLGKRVSPLPLYSEGMDGISYRVSITVLDNAFSYNAMREKECINPVLVDRFLREALERGQIISKDAPELKRYIELAKLVFDDYKKSLRRDLTRAFIGAKQEYAEDLFQKYLDEAEIFLKSQFERTRRPDEEFLAWVDGKKDVATARNFRQGIVEYARECKASGKPLHYQHYEEMRKAIDAIIINTMEKLMRMPSENRLRSAEQQQDFENHVEKLIQEFGYCKICAPYLWNWYAETLAL